MQLFYLPDAPSNTTLSKEESYHCIKVLRYKKGDSIYFTDGKGNMYSGIIENQDDNLCSISNLIKEKSINKSFIIHLIVAPTKSFDKMEWMIEKISEIGVDEVTFIYAKHSERRKINKNRLEKKSIAAMKQSNSLIKTEINDIVSFNHFIKNMNNNGKKYIAHMDKKNKSIQTIYKKNKRHTILIGPEGDFTTKEIEIAYKKGFEGISLGENILRTETASLLACYSIIQSNM